MGMLTDARIVERSWRFSEIAERFAAYRTFLQQNPPSNGSSAVSGSFAEWFKQESALWKAALSIDPLLPRELWPPGYSGFESWEARRAAFAEWRSLLLS